MVTFICSRKNMHKTNQEKKASAQSSCSELLVVLVHGVAERAGLLQELLDGHILADEVDIHKVGSDHLSNGKDDLDHLLSAEAELSQVDLFSRQKDSLVCERVLGSNHQPLELGILREAASDDSIDICL